MEQDTINKIDMIKCHLRINKSFSSFCKIPLLVFPAQVIVLKKGYSSTKLNKISYDKVSMILSFWKILEIYPTRQFNITMGVKHRRLVISLLYFTSINNSKSNIIKIYPNILLKFKDSTRYNQGLKLT